MPSSSCPACGSMPCTCEGDDEDPVIDLEVDAELPPAPLSPSDEMLPLEDEDAEGELGQFSKYMEGIVRREQTARLTPPAADTPQRIYNKRYREFPGNRVRFSGK